MAKPLSRPLRETLAFARHTLGMSQHQFGPALGWSHRTAVRWERGLSTPTDTSLVKLAGLLVPLDVDLAAEVAKAAGETLESLGLVSKPVADKPGLRATPDDLADTVLCAVAEAADLPPRVLRPILHAAFVRARAIGLTVEQLEESMRARIGAKKDADKAGPRMRLRVAREAVEEGEVEAVVERGRRARVR
jgi:transcriptional regulator with XRE-family HTH domain